MEEIKDKYLLSGVIKMCLLEPSKTGLRGMNGEKRQISKDQEIVTS